MGRPQAGFAHLRPPLMSNVRRRMAATEMTGRANPSGASGRTVASTVARLAVLVATRCGRSVPPGREPTGVPSRRSGARCHRTGRPAWAARPARGWSRKVVLARKVRSLPMPCGRTRCSCTLKAMNSKAATPLSVTVVPAWKRCGTPSPTTPNPSIEGTSNIWLRQLSAAPHVKR